MDIDTPLHSPARSDRPAAPFVDAASRPDLPTYARDDHGWRRLQTALPEPLRLPSAEAPREEWLAVGDMLVHVDRHRPGSPPAGGGAGDGATLVVVHGGGGNGRLLAPFARMASAAGFTALAPDLPGYGLTRVPAKRRLVYEDWRRTLAAVVRAEQTRVPGRAIVLFGLSMGGMLAYDVMARTRIPARLVATTLLDPGDPDARACMLRWRGLSAALPALWSLRALTDHVPIPLRWTTRMSVIANDPAVAKIVATDPRAGGTWMPGRWARTFLTSRPVVPPASFDVGPVTLAHPDADPWTPPELSLRFLQRLTRVPTSLDLLPRAGHLPLEEPGRTRLARLIVEELRAATLTSSRG